MKKIIFALLIVFIACDKQEKADLLVINGNVYTVSDSLNKTEAFAVRDGKIIEVGKTDHIQSKYASLKTVNANGKAVFPGLIDAHCHFYRLGLQQQKVNVVDTKSYDEVLEKLVAFQKEKNVSYITGRGWDQNDWEVKEFPTKEKLDALFPNTPVAITRVDGHALLVNQAAIDLAGITIETKFTGGDILQKDGKLTGIFIDKPMELIRATIPEPTIKEATQALKDAERMCFDLGLTTVDDAGLSQETIELIDSLHTIDELKMRVYAMVSANEKNLDYYLKKGISKTDRLNVRSFKMYGDGALGSRGAAMRAPYSDKLDHHGALVNSIAFLQSSAERIANSEFQMNTHAIGDSANHIMLQTYKEVLKDTKDRRWRIEHSQIVSSEDFELFDDIMPSIQPTHATSDMYWAEDRVGAERIKGGYAFKDLLNIYGKVALGTDFPVEKVNPFLTFYAAVARKDLQNFPESGYQMENALSREETLKGMTIWAAYSNFEEHEKGSIEVGKFADFVILNQDIMEVDIDKVPTTIVVETYVNGEKVK